MPVRERMQSPLQTIGKPRLYQKFDFFCSGIVDLCKGIVVAWLFSPTKVLKKQVHDHSGTTIAIQTGAIVRTGINVDFFGHSEKELRNFVHNKTIFSYKDILSRRLLNSKKFMVFPSLG
jgi:hypothetical protein